MQVKDYMYTTLYTIAPDESAEAAARVMKRHNIGSLLVKSSEGNNHYMGIVTERDLTRKVVAAGDSAKRTKVREIMTKSLIMIDAEEDVSEAAKLLEKYHIKRLVVIEEGRIVGIISNRRITEKLGTMLKKKSR